MTNSSIAEIAKQLHTDAKRRLYVVQNKGILKLIRGSVSQMAMSLHADVPSAYICRVEQGNTYGIGAEALRRILNSYLELAESLDAGKSYQVRQTNRLQDEQGSRDG